MQVDAVSEPVVAGRTLVLPAVAFDGLLALDVETGAERWRFRTDGPLRFPAAIDGGLAYAACDDGRLYAVALETGALAWSFRGGPSDRKVLGNGRLISTWPARGAPVVKDGTVYFAAGIWPFMGIFLHALEAKTGRPIWVQDGEGSTYRQQPHNTDAFAGVAPQGPIAVHGDRLYVPGGRSVPAVFDRRTGKLIHYKHAENGRRGGADVAVAGDVYFAGGSAFDAATGLFVADYAREFVAGSDRFFYAGKRKDLLSAPPPVSTMRESLDRKGQPVKKIEWKTGTPESAETPPVQCLIRAGGRLYAGVEGGILVFEEGKRPRRLYELAIEGTPASLVAAAGRLFVTTREGLLLSFSASGGGVAHAADRLEPPARGGYEVVFAEGPAKELLGRIRSSPRHVIVFHPEADQVAELRRLLEAEGRYGTRAAVLQGAPPLAPYFAERVGVAVPTAERLRAAFPLLRPFGGRLDFPAGGVDRQALEDLLEEEGFDGAQLEGESAIVRAGALPGSADWTREHADAANTRVSRDRLVKAPLGLLWFGGPSNEGLLPRHGHGPQPQVLDGRLFLEGIDGMRAIDLYTGRLLWETPLPGLGDFYNNTAHQPGANSTGSNYVSTREGIYVAWKDRCVRLDPATGAITKEYRLPGGGAWGAVAVAGELLIGGADPLQDIVVARSTEGGFDDPAAGEKDKEPDKERASLAKLLLKFRGDNDSYSSSRKLVAFERDSGRPAWTAEAKRGFRHNSICIGGGRLFVIDRLSGPQAERLKKKGQLTIPGPNLVAIDLRNGKELYRVTDGVFGTFLSYSEELDLLVESGRVARDALIDEPKGMLARRGSDGVPQWERKNYSGPAMIHGETILMVDKACDLRTGAPRGRIHPLTLEPSEWTWTRTYGCNTPMASEHLLTFRSGAAGFFDLALDGGTGNLGGFRSGCTNNLVVAGGVLCAPDYTRTCLCSYQNQTSIALVPMPENELWTYFGSTEVKGMIRRLGLNFGAPGDRRAEDGTLWLEFPASAGKSPSVSVSVSGDRLSYFRRHASVASGRGHPWVAASGVIGVREVVVQLAKEAKEDLDRRVRLTFVEPEGLGPGARVFDVEIQGETAFEGVDPAAEGAGPWRAVVREASGICAGKDLRIRFRARSGRPVLCGLEILPNDQAPLLKAGPPPEALTVPETRRSGSADPDAEPPVFRWPAGVEPFLWIVLGGMLFFALVLRVLPGRAR
jgi:outer membrane protein assembly factor BamB